MTIFTRGATVYRWQPGLTYREQVLLISNAIEQEPKGLRRAAGFRLWAYSKESEGGTLWDLYRLAGYYLTVEGGERCWD